MKKLILTCILLIPTIVGAENVTVTGYHSKPNCVMASTKKITTGHYGNVIALSPDLARRFRFGEKFQLKINGEVYIVEYWDRMPHPQIKSVDLLLPSSKSCKRLGRSKGELTLIKRGGS
jgi:hypothetical protein